MIATTIDNRRVVFDAPARAGSVSYVSHQGQRHAADAGYPATVLMDLAGQTGQLVILPCEGGALLGFCGDMSRTRFVSRGDETIWARTLSRAALMSTGPALVIGQSDIPAQRVDLADIPLPPIVSRKATLLVLAKGLGLLAVTGVLLAATVKVVDWQAGRVSAEVKANNLKRDALLKEIADLEAKDRPTTEQDTANTTTLALPRTAVMLSATLMPVRVKDGHAVIQ
jgi:hypothetical protein